MFKYEQIQLQFNNRILLKDSSISLKRHYLTTIIGESGCGKTTLLNYIFSHTNKQKTRVLYLKQEDNFFNEMNCLDNLIFMSKIYGVNPSIEQINDALSKVQLNIDLKKYPKTLSGGERQRLLLSLALLIHCDIILMDEITASLDIQGKEAFIKILKNISQINNCAIVVVTHDQILIDNADIIYKIENKEIICLKDAHEEQSECKHQTTLSLPLVQSYLKAKFKKDMPKDLITCLILSIIISLSVTGMSFLYSLKVGNEKISSVIPENQIMISNNHLSKHYNLNNPLFNEQEIKEIYNLKNSVIYPTIVLPMTNSNNKEDTLNKQPIYKIDTYINGQLKKMTIDTNTGTSLFPHLYPMYPEQKQETLASFKFSKVETDGIPCYLSERTAQYLMVPLDQQSFSIKASFDIPYHVENENIEYYEKENTEHMMTQSILYQYQPKEFKLNVIGIIPDRVNQYGYDGIIVDYTVINNAIEEIPNNSLLINNEYKISNSYMIFNDHLDEVQIELNEKLSNVSYSNTRSSYINKNLEIQKPLINSTKKIMIGTTVALLISLVLLSIIKEKNYKKERELLKIRAVSNIKIKKLFMSNGLKQSLLTLIISLILFMILFNIGVQKQYFTSLTTSNTRIYGLLICTLLSILSGFLTHLYSVLKK